VTDARAPDAPVTPLRRLGTPGYDLAWAWQSPIGESVASFFNAVDNPLGRAIAHRLAISGARAIATRIADDWSNLASVEDGTIVSLVGRARATQTFSFRIADRPVIGLMLRFPMRTLENPETAFVGRQRRIRTLSNAEKMQGLGWRTERVDLEAAYDFELVGPSGQRAAVLVDGARLMGKPSFPLRHVPEAPELLEAIGPPADADLTNVYGAFLWDETPVELIGPKRTRSLDHGPPITIGDTDEPPTLIIPRGRPPPRPT
jgi:hypothetical protein